MTVSDPDSLYFEMIDGVGAAQINLQSVLGEDEWTAIGDNDVYHRSYLGLRRFLSEGDAEDGSDEGIVTTDTSYETVREGFWSTADGRSAIEVEYDMTNCDLRVDIMDDASSSLDSGPKTASETTRAEGSISFTSLGDTDGWFTVEMKVPSSGTAVIHSIVIREVRIAQADL